MTKSSRNLTLVRLVCMRCGYGKEGHDWVPRIADPAQCPRCHSPRWDQAKKVVETS